MIFLGGGLAFVPALAGDEIGGAAKLHPQSKRQKHSAQNAKPIKQQR